MSSPYELGRMQGVAGGISVSQSVAHGSEVTLLASAAQTTTQTQADQANTSKQGIDVGVSISAVGTGSITVVIEGKDSLSGLYYTVLTSAALIANAFTRLRVYPSLTAVANSRENDVLPGVWRIRVVANNANPVTYSVSYRLLG